MGSFWALFRALLLILKDILASFLQIFRGGKGEGEDFRVGAANGARKPRAQLPPANILPELLTSFPALCSTAVIALTVLEMRLASVLPKSR